MSDQCSTVYTYDVYIICIQCIYIYMLYIHTRTLSSMPVYSQFCLRMQMISLAKTSEANCLFLWGATIPLLMQMFHDKENMQALISQI